MLKKKYSCKHIGKEFVTNEGYLCKIINGGSVKDYCTIQIENYVREARVDQTIKGNIKYPYHKSVFSVGFVGEGKYSKKTHKDIYCKWDDMLERSYSSKSQKKHPTYVGTIVCRKWHNFQNFAAWYERFCPTNGSDHVIDKDLLKSHSKIYSPQTCLFVPQSLNNFMTNIKRTNTSGHVGIYWSNTSNKWVAEISIDSKSVYLGLFTNIEEASKSYQMARIKQVKRWQAYYSFNYPKLVLDRLR